MPLARSSWCGAPLLTVVLIVVAGIAAGCGGGAVRTTAGEVGAASLDRYTSSASWSVSRPPGLHLERSGVTGRLTVSEVTIASFVPRPPIHSWSKGNSSGSVSIRHSASTVGFPPTARRADHK